MSPRASRSRKRRPQRPAARRFGAWWPLWSMIGGAAIAGLTVVMMRYVG